jgi:hypothetical protein
VPVTRLTKIQILQHAPSRPAWGFLFGNAVGGVDPWIENRTKNGGRGDHTQFKIAHTRPDAQFSLGKANLTHHPDLASGPGKIISIFRIGFVS